MLRVTKLSKYYGHKRALLNLNFEVEAGARVGLLGLNGAGKSTLLRIIAGIHGPSDGVCSIRSGVHVTDSVGGGMVSTDDGPAYRRHVGILSDTRELYDDLTVHALLIFMEKLRSRDDPELSTRDRIDRAVALSDLSGVLHQRVGTLSLGFRKRVALACATIHQPTLLLLDEPFSGLDPIQCDRFIRSINALNEAVTLIISSHMIDLVEQCVKYALVVRKGELSYDGVFKKERIAEALV